MMRHPARMLGVLWLSGAAALAAAPLLAAPADGDARAAAKRGAQKRTVGVFDNYFQPRKLTLNRNSTITWRWDETAADVHDVKVTRAPKGFRKFHTEPGAAGFSYRTRLTKPGKYSFLCTFHENDGMRMTVTVRR